MDKIPPLDTTDWKEIPVEYGPETISVRVPPDCAIVTMKEMPVLADPTEALEAALSKPIGSLPLEEIIKAKGKSPLDLVAAVTVSDITRPVPYKGEKGMLRPLLSRLERAGIRRGNIKIIVGNGMHSPGTPAEHREMFGEEIMEAYRIVDHDCQDRENLTFVGKSATGGDVFVNRHFFAADLRIATGLVESHFMAGFSGGRKSVCPGLVDKRTIEKFHSPAFLESPLADNLILEGNPCHEEALAIARTVGVDFIVNATLDKDLRPTGFFAGDLQAAHLAAAAMVKQYVSVPLSQQYDVVLTHGGYVGRNHYQAVKAVYNALPALRRGGTLILATNNRDREPIGGPEYKTLLHLLKLQGRERYMEMIGSPSWRFTKDQWEPEMWAKVFRKLDEERFVYCTHTIGRDQYCLIPGRCGLDYLPAARERLDAAAVGEMVEAALREAVAIRLAAGVRPSVAFIREGPYAIPYLAEGQEGGG